MENIKMEKLYIKATSTTPEIYFSPLENVFSIRGISAPEDVRAVYYPVIEWLTLYINLILEVENKQFTKDSALIFRTDLMYFNSSSAKFLYDIYFELKRLDSSGIPVKIEWVYDEEDIDLKEAGADIALLVGMEFSYIAK
jgi:SiaC family regulatory phosphoprotein